MVWVDVNDMIGVFEDNAVATGTTSVSMAIRLDSSISARQRCISKRSILIDFSA